MKASDIQFGVKAVMKKWTAQRKREERSPNARFHRSEYIYSNRVNQTDVAWDVIPKAYEKASSGGTLPAHARQVYYAARKEIQERTGRPVDSVYFTQTLLPRYINDHPSETANLWVVYDPRGNLIEPHTKLKIPLGTIEVDKYLRKIGSHKIGGPEPRGSFSISYPTCGPKGRFQAILFIEKEGFNPLFEAVKLAERYDIAIMSTKGQSVVAARRLVDELCYGDVPLLVLHDFDKEGFLISERLTSVSDAAEEAGRVRYEFQNDINVIDLGLRLRDVNKWKLEAEDVKFKGGFETDSIATPEEQEFLRGNQRVELNAFSSGDLIEWIEGLLDEHGIKKVIPDKETLDGAFRRACQIAHMNADLGAIEKRAKKKAEAEKIPRNLMSQIRKGLEEDPALPWDEVLGSIVKKRMKKAS